MTSDLQHIGIDVWDRDLMRARPFAWLRAHITGLVTRPFGRDGLGEPLFANQLQEIYHHDLNPAAFEAPGQVADGT